MASKAGQPSFISQWAEGLNKKALAFGFLIFLAAFLFRLPGITWGLPTADNHSGYHPDEPVNIAYSQQVDPLKGDFSPDFYNYGTFYLTLTHFAAKAAVTYGGGIPEGTPQEEARAKIQAQMILGGRVLSALGGAGMAVLVFLILYRRTHEVGAFLAGAAIAVAPGLLVHSRFATVDVPAAFFGTLSLYWAARLIPYPGQEPLEPKTFMRFAAWSGLMAGLSASCKYTGVLFLIAPLWIIGAAYFSRAESVKKSNLLKAAALACGVCLAAFLITMPAIVLETGRVLKDVVYEFQHTATGHGLVFEATSPGFIYHLGNLSEGYGLLLVLLGVAGLARGAYRGHSWITAILAVTLVIYLLIGRAEVKFLRYIFPLLPGLAVGLGWIVGQAHTHPKPAWKGLGIAAFLGLGGIFGGGLTRAVQVTSWMTGADPRDLAAAWIKANVKPDQTVGLVSDPWFYTPPFFPDATAHIMSGWENKEKWMAESSPRAVRHTPADPAERFDWDTRLITEDFPDYIIFSSFEQADVARVAAAGVSKEVPALLAKRYLDFISLSEANYEAKPAMIFGGGGSAIHDMMYIQPTLWIWKKKEGLSKPVMPGSMSSSSSETSASTP